MVRSRSPRNTGVAILLATASLVLGCTTSALNSDAVPAGPDDLPLFGTITDDGWTDFVATKASLESWPTWEPEQADIPLSASAAVTIAKAHFLLTHPKFEGAIVQAIELRPARCCKAFMHRWYYSISFLPTVEGKPINRDSAPVVVLLNGTVAKEVKKRE